MNFLAKFIIIFVLFVNSATYSQEIAKYYLNESLLEVAPGNHKYYQIVKNDSKNAPFEQTTFFLDGTMYSNGKFSDKGFAKGIWNFYHPNGNLKETIYYDKVPAGYYAAYYENGHMKLEGTIMTNIDKAFPNNVRIKNYWNTEYEQVVFDGNGTLFIIDDEVAMEGKIKNGLKDSIWHGACRKSQMDFAELYKDGELQSGISIDSTQATHRYTKSKVYGGPIGGFNAFYDVLFDQIDKSRNFQSSSYTVVSFVIDSNGKFESYKVLSESAPGIGDQFAKIIKSYRGWTPYYNRGIAMKQLYSIPLTTSVDEKQSLRSFQNDPSRRGLHFANPPLSDNRIEYR